MSQSMPPDAYWRDALSGGRLMIQRSRSTGQAFFPPRIAAPGTGEDDIEWIEASGGGTVYSVTVVNQKAPAEPYNVVLVDLDEGPRLMSRVDGIAPDAVTIGLRVQAKILPDVDTDGGLLVFTPA
jgi:uncharacterized OB-fold protein